MPRPHDGVAEESQSSLSPGSILSNCKVGSYNTKKRPSLAPLGAQGRDFMPQRPGSHGQTLTEGLTYQEREREGKLLESGLEPRQGSRRVGVWDAACDVGRVQPTGPLEHSFLWFEDKRMRDLGSQREEGMLCGRNGMNQDSETGMRQVTEDRKAQGQRPREERSGQIYSRGLEP